MTRTPRITSTPNGRAYLHIWRTGQSYARQKGALYRREWTNVLFSTRQQPIDEPDILYHDVRHPLPFDDGTFDAVYALHIVEHLTAAEAETFVKELARVLKPGAIIRISTPDLEDICHSYLRQLEACRPSRSEASIVRYRWAVLELLDQIVREQSGGLMSQAVARGDFDREFAMARFGDVFDEFAPRLPRPDDERHRPFLARLATLTPASLVASIRWRLGRIVDSSVRAPVAGPRETGELNKWLYDELSLEMLLTAGGFRNPIRQDHRSSTIPDWSRYALDESTHGPHAIEPSLYFEATKPH